jgi:long-chain acyl-CoA synthetase
MTSVDRGDDPYAARPWLASYPPNTPADLDPNSYSTLTKMFRDSVAAFSGRLALESFGASLTYAEFGKQADAVASWLQSQGLAKGDRVAIMAPNIMAYPVVLFGALLAGGVVVNVNPLYTPDELEHQINDSDARILFVMENFAHTVASAWADMMLKTVVVIAPGDLLGVRGVVVNFVSRWVKRAVPPFKLAGSLSLADVLRAGARTPPQPVEISRDDIAFLQYTGGTTGVAKGAVLLHSNVAANVEQTLSWLRQYLPQDGHQVMVAALPLYHIFGLTACCMLMVRIGAASLLIANPRDIAGFAKTLRKSYFTLLSGVNTLYSALADQPEFAEADFSHLIYCVAGGMATQDSVAMKWKQLTGKPILEGYGLSETSPILTINSPDLQEFSGAIGYPQASTLVTIRLDDGSPAQVGERGELWVKGPQVMPGYWNRPDETAKVMTADGFFRTGDIAVMAPDGLLKIVDRLKEMILVSGFNVYPNEVENALAHHPQVKEAAVIGVPDPHSGEAPMAFVVRRDPSLTAEELHKFLRETLTSYKVPRLYEFRDVLPKSTVGKILRRVLRDEYLARK